LSFPPTEAIEHL